MAQLLKLTPDSIILMAGLGAVGYYLYVNKFPPFGTNEFRLPFLDDVFNNLNGSTNNSGDQQNTGIPQVQIGGNAGGKPAITYDPLPRNQQQLPQNLTQTQYQSDLENQFYRMLYLQQLNDTSQYPYNYNQDGPTTVGDPLLNDINFPSNTNTSSALIVPSVSSIVKGGSFSVQASGFAAGEVIFFIVSANNIAIGSDAKTAGDDGKATLSTLSISSTAALGSATVVATGLTSGRIATATIQIVGSSNAVYIKSNWVPRDIVEIDYDNNSDDRNQYLNALKHKKSSRSAILYASRNIRVN